MARKPEADAKYLLDRSIIRWRAISAILLAGIRWSAMCVIAYWAYRSIESLAGQQTFAQFIGTLDMKFLANRYASQIIFAIFGVGGVGYGVRAKRLHDKVVDKLRRLEEYERLADENRTGSGLKVGSRANPDETI